jgi:hypothetical protein
MLLKFFRRVSCIDDAIDMINRIGKGGKLTKTDIKSAFRLLRVSPSDFDQLGFSFDNKFYFDKCLPFGASTQCLGMLRVLSALQFYLRLQEPPIIYINPEKFVM